MSHPEHRIVGWILEPSTQCACGKPAKAQVALYGDLCQVIEQCDSCVPRTATDEIAEILAAALAEQPTREV